MKVRSLLIGTALLSMVVGAIVTWLVLTVPNDLRASALLRDARKEITAGHNDKARTSLSKIVQQYPRTDAAAAATVALVTLGDSERTQLERDIAALQKENVAQKQQISVLTLKVDEIASAPKPAPVIVQAPAPKAATPKSVVKKKPVRRTRHRARRR